MFKNSIIAILVSVFILTIALIPSQLSDAQTSTPPNLTTLTVGTPTGSTSNIGTHPIKITLAWTDSTTTTGTWKVFDNGVLAKTVTSKSTTLQPLEKGIEHCITIQRTSPTTSALSNIRCSHVQPVITSLTQTARNEVTITWTQAQANNPTASATGFKVEKVEPTPTLTEVCSSGSTKCASGTFTQVSPNNGPLSHKFTVADRKYICTEVQASWASPRITMDADKVCIQMDITPPVLSNLPVLEPVEVTSPAGAVVTYTNPTATDNVDPNPTVTCVLPSDSTFPYTPNPSKETKTSVTCTATDFSGNSATASFDVTTTDTTPPGITQDTIPVQNWLLGNPYDISIDDTNSISNNDIFDGLISDQCASPTSNKCITKTTDYTNVAGWGLYFKRVKVIDSSENFAEKTFADSLNVVDYGYVESSTKYATTDAVNLFVNDKLATSPEVGLASTLTGASRTATLFDNPNPGEFVTNTPINLIVLGDGETAAPDQLSIKGDDTLLASYLTFNTKSKGVLPEGVAPGAFPGTATDASSKIRFKESDIYVIGNSATLQINDPTGGAGPISFTVDSVGFPSVTMSATLISTGLYETSTYVRFIDTAPQNAFDLRVPVGGGPISATYGGFTATATVITSDNTLQSALITNPDVQPDTTIKGNCPTPTNDADLDYICNAWEDQATGTGLRIPTGHTANPTYNFGCTPSATYTSDKLGTTVCPSKTIKDIYVEIDYMKNHKPSTTALEHVVSAFRAKNINLHLIVDQQIPHQTNIFFADPFNTIADPTVQDVKKDFFGSAAERANPDLTQLQNLLDGKRQVFRWALFTHTQADDPNSSGIAEIPGNDLEVSLGAFTGRVGSIGQQESTFMHELGHTLGRFHGGADDVNFKPNYPSVMNYLYQFDGSNGGLAGLVRPLDFSPFAYTAINELLVRESGIISDGVGTTNQRTLQFGFPSSGTPSGIKTYTTDTVLGNLNPSGDSDTLDTYSTTVRNFPTLSSPAAGAGRTLSATNDWISFNYDLRSTDGFGSGMITLRNPDNILASFEGELDPETIAFVSTIDDTTTNEGETTDRNIVIDDEHGTSYDIVIDNGDGTQTTASDISDTIGTTAIDHTYNDICKAGCNGDGSYPVSLDVTNDACDTVGPTCGKSPTFTAKATVLNVLPTVSINPISPINEDETIAGSGAITRASVDTVSLTVDYGDGTGPNPLPYDTDANTFILSHLYPNPGTFTVTVTADDGDGTLVSANTQVTVNAVVTYNVQFTVIKDGDVIKKSKGSAHLDIEWIVRDSAGQVVLGTYKVTITPPSGPDFVGTTTHKTNGINDGNTAFLKGDGITYDYHQIKSVMPLGINKINILLPDGTEIGELTISIVP